MNQSCGLPSEAARCHLLPLPQQACQSSRPMFIQPVKVPSRPSSLGTARSAGNSQHRRLSSAIPSDGIVPSDPPHSPLPQHPSFLPMCCFNVSVSEHPQVHRAIVNSTQVKGADPGAVFPDWPQILFSLFASSLKKRWGRKPHYCCLAVLWYQRKQNRNICRCNDGCNYKIHQRSCPSSFRLPSRTVSLFFAFPSLGAQLLPLGFQPLVKSCRLHQGDQKHAEVSPGAYTRY